MHVLKGSMFCCIMFSGRKCDKTRGPWPTSLTWETHQNKRKKTISFLKNEWSFFGSGIWPFIQTNLNSFHPKMLCTMFGWNWPTGSGEDKNVKILQTDRWMTGDQRSLLEISAQVSQKNYISHKNENRAIPDYILFNTPEV